MTHYGSFFRASIAAGAALVFAAGFVISGPRSARASSIQSSEQTGALRVKSDPADSTSEKALQARAAIKRGDFSTAHEIVASLLRDSRLKYWRFHPFSDFVGAIANANDPALEKQLDVWIAQTAHDPIPRLIRAQYLHGMAWFVRGHRFVRTTAAANLESFEDYLAKALNDAETATALADNPYGFLLKLRILSGFGISTRAKNAFEEAIAKHPGYYPLYDTLLGMLHPKWGGSVAAMHAFVDQYAGQANEHSPLKLLYLSLYRHLLNSASISCASNESNREKKAECVGTAMRDVVSPALEGSVVAALRLYDHTDKYEFGLAIEEILSEMLRTGGGESHFAAILELAAESMGSDTQLKKDERGRNDYIIDKIVAASWYQKGFYENSLIKGQEALKSIENTTFPSDAEKDLAIARIYQALARAHSRLNHYSEVLAYESAAVALGATASQEHFICYGHYRLKAYEEAIRACTKAIADDAGNMKAHFWRGRVYRDLGQLDEALRDLTAVADSHDYFRATAAIDLSMIHFTRKDIRGSLDVLNAYAYLYDPELTTRNNVAVAYNNRCYAHMQLGELNKALEDCNASLKHGSIPDAYRKRLELINRLKAQETKL